MVIAFCFAVADGVASCNYSQHCSKAVVKAIKTLWEADKSVAEALTSDAIQHLISQSKHSQKRYGAAVTVANTQRLQDWLVSMSQLPVVVAPIDLKKVVLERLQNALALYED